VIAEGMIRAKGATAEAKKREKHWGSIATYTLFSGLAAEEFININNIGST
jgi:hypothetical protein